MFNDLALKFINLLMFNENVIVILGLWNIWFNNDIVLNDVIQEDILQDDSVFSWELGGVYFVVELI